MKHTKGQPFKNLSIIIIAVLTLVNLILPTLVRAETAYRTYTQNGYNDYVETQTGYEPVDSFTITEGVGFRNPSDLKIGPDEMLYIADTNNRRIVVLDFQGDFVSEITHDQFATPVGIFVTDEGKLFVADDTAGKIFVFDAQGNEEHIFERPDAPSYGINTPFYPLKIAVDDRENVYVISRGNNNGIIMLNAQTEGEFLGYFAPNSTVESLMTRFRKIIFTDEQLDRMLDSAPNTATNLSIDDRGLLYTVTANESINDVLKKLNMGGLNLLDPNYIPYPSSVAIGNYENIYVLAENGYIYEYTSEGEFLFLFSGPDVGYQRAGLISRGVGIDVDDNGRIYTLDQLNNKIEVFQPTEFTNTLHHALDLYQNGRYTESKAYWDEIIKMNAQFDFAYLGLGEAYFRDEDFENAMTSFRSAKNTRGYSDAYWEVRNVWLRENIILMIFIIIMLFVLYRVYRWIYEKYLKDTAFGRGYRKFRGLKLIQQLSYVFYFMRHPIDGAYGIQYEKKTSNWSTLIIYLFAIFTFIVNKYFTGFIFTTVQDGQYSLPQDILIFVVVSFFVVVFTYLITTITEGEATFRQTVHAFVYSLGPYITIQWVLLLLSNVITLNEQFLLQFGTVIMITWVIVLVVASLCELNGYNIREFIRTFFLTVFAIFIAAVVIFILYVLFNQLWNFIESLYSEVVRRLGFS
ncbi:hypothetical protein [Fundicoccus culcitae]|uniref:Yip1 domain-containing protein n=1 Tax=Fundicoccus culcitae TaxID=2969821 RepID=A0ABY5P9V0_9LACT|nr:hypothetical protein [Fundicoccus culcitae]UUX35380.1 hypothetical protein NRE15_06970 [Fundicoccus culcitae]